MRPPGHESARDRDQASLMFLPDWRRHALCAYRERPCRRTPARDTALAAPVPALPSSLPPSVSTVPLHPPLLRFPVGHVPPLWPKATLSPAEAGPAAPPRVQPCAPAEDRAQRGSDSTLVTPTALGQSAGRSCQVRQPRRGQRGCQCVSVTAVEGGKSGTSAPQSGQRKHAPGNATRLPADTLQESPADKS